MSEPILSEIQIFGFNFAPRSWAKCDGQLLPINQNQSLFSLLGTTYGGDGRTTFALPDLRGRVPVHEGSGPGLSPISLGSRGGEENHTLSIQEMPAHNHTIQATDNIASNTSPSDKYLASGAQAPGYHNTSNNTMNANTVQNNGGGQSHNNMSPYLVLNICIALQGLFPSRN